MTGGAPRRILARLAGAPIRLLRGFVTIPGVISLMGIFTALAGVVADEFWLRDSVFNPFSAEAARSILSTLATAAMAALSLVYSIVLVVFTLAAGTIAPRLLERFSHDRTNQIAVGSLGALFLHAIVALTVSDGRPVFFGVASGVLMACASVLLLLIFVDRVARRVTIDEEIAAIADELDAEFDRAASRSAGIEREALVRPDGRVQEVYAPLSGYVNSIAAEVVLAEATDAEGFVDFTIAPGDAVLKGDLIALVAGNDPDALAAAAKASLSIGDRRTAEGDLRFSIALILEIALRALSPGVNDSFTAIAAMDRLTASLARAAENGVTPGVYCDAEGAARVTAPKETLADLIAYSFAPIRRAARDNILVSQSAARALQRLLPKLDDEGRRAAASEIELFAAEIAGSDALQKEREDFVAFAKAR